MPPATQSRRPGFPVAVLVVGPLHLFRTTAIYYARELLAHFDLMIVAEEGFAQNALGQVVAAWPGVIAILELPHRHTGMRYHRAAIAAARHATASAPALLLQHHDVFPHNLYLATAMPEGCLTVTYAAGMTLDQAVDFAYIRADKAAEIARRFRLPSVLAHKVAGLRSAWAYLLRYKVFPFLLTGRVLNPQFDPATGHKKNARHAPSQVRLMYTARERDLHLRYFPDDRLALVSHPLRQAAPTLHEELGLPKQAPGIAFLPSWGFSTELARQHGAEAAAEMLFTGWRDVLVAVRQRLGELPIAIKLHPAAAHDPLMQDMVARLARALNGVTILEPSHSAERMVVTASCVVGDVSSILWWALMLGGRSVVSADLWNLPLGDEMSHYPGVLYFKAAGTSCAIEPLPIDGNYPRAIDFLVQAIFSSTKF